MSRFLLLVLVAAVTSQIIIPEDGETEVRVGAEDDHVSVLQQLQARVEQLEEERKLRGQEHPADRLQVRPGQLWF